MSADIVLYVLAVVAIVGVFALYSRSTPPFFRGLLIGMGAEALITLGIFGWLVNR